MRKPLLLAVSMLLFFHFCLAQLKQVSGKITNAKSGLPIAGATITAKQSTTATISGTDGSFTISVKSGEKELTVTYIGFADATVPVTGTEVSVQLTETAQNLNEVVVIGYGTTTRKNLTGNIAVVKGADIQNMPVPNFNQALQGRAAGVFVESESGKVGEGIKIRIRGSGSLSAGNDPLYVIDGLPINNTSYASNVTSNSTTGASGNPLATINFNDIESFNILKDAAATAIYGSRGANGVVIITTKKGKAGKTSIQVNAQYGSNKPTHLRGFLNAPEYIALLREAAINSDLYFDGIDPTDPANYADSYLEYAEGRLDRYSHGADWRNGKTVNTNWEKLAFNDHANTAGLDISASGGNEKTKFYLSGSYLDQEGILIRNNFKRLSGRINIDHTVSDHVKIGANLSLSQTVAGRVTYDNNFDNPLQIVALSPVTPVRDEDGNLYNIPTTTYYNPLVDARDGKYRSETFRNIGSVYFDWKILNHLTFRSDFGVDLQYQNDDQFYPEGTINGTGIGGYGQSDWYKFVDYNTNNFFTYNQGFGKHTINVVAGMAFQSYHYDFANVYGQDFPTPELQKLASAGKITGGTSSAQDSRLLSYFARADYSFANKYLVGLSGRYDGSSKFGANNRYGFFPAVSAGWVISQEDFLKNSDLISNLKIRGSYGLAGNDNIPNDGSLTLWQGAPYAGSSGLTTYQLGNPDLKWEISKQADIGLEVGILHNKLTAEIDWYNRKTSELIYNVPVPGNSGFTTQLVNVGSMLNRGVEFVLNTENVSGKDFKWTTSFNLSYNKNKVLKLDGAQTSIPGNDGRYLNSLIVGQSIGIFYGPRFAGVDKANGDALYYAEDGKTTTNDYNAAGNFIVGNPNPDWIGGVTNTFSYKGLELNVLFQGVFGNQIMNGAGGFMSASFDYFDNQTREMLDRWQKPGDITNVPQLRLLGGNGISASSRYIYDGDYVRLKNITLSYTLPAAWMQKLKIQTARLYVTAVNLVTWTNYPGWDPEVNSDYRSTNRNQGADFYSAPQIKNYTVGINLGL